MIPWPGLLKLEFIWGKDAKVMVGAIGIEPTAPCTSIRDPFFTSSKLTIKCEFLLGDSMTTYNHEEVKQKVLLQLQYEDMGPTRLFNFVHEILKDETEAKKFMILEGFEPWFVNQLLYKKKWAKSRYQTLKALKS